MCIRVSTTTSATLWAGNMTDFVKKYQVDEALTRLIAKYPRVFLDSKYMSCKLEDVIPPNDPDLATIRVFRDAIKLSDWKKKQGFDAD